MFTLCIVGAWLHIIVDDNTALFLTQGDANYHRQMSIILLGAARRRRITTVTNCYKLVMYSAILTYLRVNNDQQITRIKLQDVYVCLSTEQNV